MGAAEVAAFLHAVGFLTVLPVPRRSIGEFSGAAVAFFPLVGLLVGVAVAAGDTAAQALPLPLRSILALAVWLLITGALHFDGWVDVCDAMAPGLDRQRARAAMRDPRAGAIGVAGAVLLLLTKWSALSSVVDRRFALIVFAAVAARWVVALMLAFLPTGDGHPGLGAEVSGALSARHALLPSVVVVGALAWVTPSAWALSLALCSVAAVLLAAVLKRRVGALTGDGYGAAVELSESVVLLVAAAGWAP